MRFSMVFFAGIIMIIVLTVLLGGTQDPQANTTPKGYAKPQPIHQFTWQDKIAMLALAGQAEAASDKGSLTTIQRAANIKAKPGGNLRKPMKARGHRVGRKKSIKKWKPDRIF